MNNSQVNTNATPSEKSDQLKVFISSKMDEFIDARSEIEKALAKLHIDAFVYEHSAGARPQSIIEVCLSEVEKTDILVGLFADEFGEITLKEIQHARALNKPCLIYRRKIFSNKPKHEPIFDPQSGLAYAFFENSVDLSYKVGQDIMRLLVQAYRKSNRLLPVHSISPIIKLAWDVRDWYQAIGYTLKDDPKPISSGVMSFTVQANPQFLGFDSDLEELKVCCVTGLIEADKLKELYMSQMDTPRQKVQFISDLAIAPKARKYAENKKNISVITFDELIEKKIHFDTYFNWLESEVKKHGIDKNYIILACTKKEELINWENWEYEPGTPSWSEEEGGIDNYIKIWLKNVDKEHLSILGEFGTGKTWFIYHLAWKCLLDFRAARDNKDPRPRIPLVIPLRDYAKAVTIESLFSEFFFRKHNIGMPSYEAFQQLNRMGKLLLLFDGFDEMADRIDKQKMINNFWEFARVLTPGSKVILTCRTEHFPEAKEGRALLNAQLRASVATLTVETPQFEVIELEMFNSKQIRKVLQMRKVPSEVRKALIDNEQLMDLAKRPLMLEYILDAMPDIKDGAPIDLSRIYLYAIRSKMKQDILQERAFTSMADKLYFLCEISWEMLSRDEMKLNYRQFPERLRRLFGKVVEEQKDLDHWRYEMMGQAMLIRDEEGNYSPAHRSLLEFFVAYKFVAELGGLSTDFTDLARDLKNTDPQLNAQDYRWSNYFHREVDSRGTPLIRAPLRCFEAEKIEEIADSSAYVSADKLPPNSLSFAACMVSNEAEVLNNLCRIAWEKEGILTNNALVLFPFLKYQYSKILAQKLAQESKGRPLTYGVGWVLGELGENLPVVVDSLTNTAKAFSERNEGSDNDWWQTGFALEKIGYLGPKKGLQGEEAVNFLFQYLPANSNYENSVNRLTKAIRSASPETAFISQVDIIVIIKNKHLFDPAVFFRDILSGINFANDQIKWRCYYVVWLCGHLQIKDSIPSLLLACKNPLSSVRNCAVESLGKIGTPTPEVVKALENGLKDNYYRTRYHAAWSLGELKSAGSIKYLEKVMKTEDVLDVRKEMLRVHNLLTNIQ